MIDKNTRPILFTPSRPQVALDILLQEQEENLKNIRELANNGQLVELTKLLRMLREQNPEIKEIVIAGYPSLENPVQAINEGTDAYIIKPFNPSDLVAKIKEIGL